MKVFANAPSTWQELQDFTGKLFREIGYEVEVSKVIETVRCRKEIDVYVEDTSSEFTVRYLIECKFWNKPVNHEVVHAFHSVMSDFGANQGFIVSKSGFQKGAFDAIVNTNIQLVTLEELESRFYKKWQLGMIKKYMPYSDELFPYWDFASPKRPRDGVVLNWEERSLLCRAYRPLTLLNTHMVEKLGLIFRYPLEIPELNDFLQIVGKTAIHNDRELFDFIEGNKEKALKHFKMHYKEP